MKILTILAVIVFLGFLVYAMNYGINLHETNECLRWERELEEIEGYYLTDWQKAQCYGR